MGLIYRLVIIGSRGMYTSGDPAASPELARQSMGVLIRKDGAKLGIVEQRRLPGYWADSAGNQHERFSDSVLVEIEARPGEWAVSGSTF